ncbi:MAG: hypothetical protein IPK39_19800 [Sulfuritalea sp.]|nr:hypothetical protein [Sulfuritalea sp.]
MGGKTQAQHQKGEEKMAHFWGKSALAKRRRSRIVTKNICYGKRKRQILEPSFRACPGIQKYASGFPLLRE